MQSFTLELILKFRYISQSRNVSGGIIKKLVLNLVLNPSLYTINLTMSKSFAEQMAYFQNALAFEIGPHLI